MASTLISALETRLKDRLGLAATVAIGDARVLEAMNAGVSRAYADGVPGLTARTIVGYSAAEVTNVIAAHTAVTDVLTMTDALVLVFPGDLIEVGSDTYLIHKVDVANKKIYLGTPIETTQATVTATITRRSIKIPNSTVYGVTINDDVVDMNSRALLTESSGGRHGMAVGHNDFTGETYMNIIPAPSAGTRIVIQLRGLKAKLVTSDLLDVPESVLDAILERAREAFLRWSGDIGQVEAATAAAATNDTENQLKAAAASRGAKVSV